MKDPGSTPPFRGSDGAVVPGSIAEVDYHRIGGVDQWVMIRGESLANPPLILLHGGPGFSDTSFFRHFNHVLEKRFTVVYWDQRGTGKSYATQIPRSSMTVQQFLADLDEIVELVRKRTGKSKVVLLGHSWGTALGALYSARFPEKVAAYVGAAQIGNAAAAEAASYAFAVAEARRLHNRKVLKKLLAIGPPPHDAKRLVAERMSIQRLEAQARGESVWSNIAKSMVDSPESSIFDLWGVLRGFRFSLDAMCAETTTLNLLELVPELKMPVFIFLGRRDRWVPPEMSAAFFEALKAPAKQLLWFEESAHEMFVDEPARFNAAMVELVRPAAVALP